MKHDEKKIKEINKKIKQRYVRSERVSGIDYYLIPIQEIEDDMKQYAEYMSHKRYGCKKVSYIFSDKGIEQIQKELEKIKQKMAGKLLLGEMSIEKMIDIEDKESKVKSIRLLIG